MEGGKGTEEPCVAARGSSTVCLKKITSSVADDREVLSRPLALARGRMQRAAISIEKQSEGLNRRARVE